MAAGDDLARTMSRNMSRNLSGRPSFGSGSRRSWASASIHEAWNGQGDVFQKSGREDDEDELMWAALERLPTYDRLQKAFLKHVRDDGKVGLEAVDVTNLGVQDKQHLMESMLKVIEDDNEKFLLRVRDRTDRVGIQIPKIEIRFEHLSIEGDAYAGSRALPTLANASLNFLEGLLGMFRVFPSKKTVIKIMHDVSGIVKPSRMVLVLGPPGSGKTTFLQSLAGEMDKDLRSTGRITYCGHDFCEFVPQRNVCLH
ncbi:unnamed protein product [Rhodiola kirilowii]